MNNKFVLVLADPDPTKADSFYTVVNVTSRIWYTLLAAKLQAKKRISSLKINSSIFRYVLMRPN